MKINNKNIITQFLMLFITLNCIGQILLKESEITLNLKNSIEVKCYQKYIDNDFNSYYYIPVNLRFSKNNKSKPEFSFLLYKDKNNNPQGGIMHWLLTWGLTKTQLLEANKLLKLSKGNKAKIVGSVFPELFHEKREIIIEGKSKQAQIIKKSATNFGKIPTLANSKSASSFNFNSGDALEIQNTLKSPIKLKEIIISMCFKLQFKSSQTHSLITEKYYIKNNFYQLINPII